MSEEKGDVTIKEKCRLCSFWKPFQDGTGQCHCKAPLPYLYKLEPEQETTKELIIWPVTEKDDYCGEFMPNKKV